MCIDPVGAESEGGEVGEVGEFRGLGGEVWGSEEAMDEITKFFFF